MDEDEDDDGDVPALIVSKSRGTPATVIDRYYTQYYVVSNAPPCAAARACSNCPSAGPPCSPARLARPPLHDSARHSRHCARKPRPHTAPPGNTASGPASREALHFPAASFVASLRERFQMRLA
jgi:hypothetical protein